MLKATRCVVDCMVSDFDRSVVGVLSGGEMLEDCLEDALLGSLELVQLYVTDYDERVCIEVASVGRLDVLKWLRRRDPPCPWNTCVCRCAALNGHLDVLIWLRSQDPPCPWDTFVC
jgi:hypothetical protein